MINEMNVRNFIRIIEADIEIGNVTLLYGPNSEGKSSILRALDLLLCAILGPINDYPDLSDYARIDNPELTLEAQLDEPFSDRVSLKINYSYFLPIIPLFERESKVVSELELKSEKYGFVHRYDTRSGGQVLWREQTLRINVYPPPKETYLLENSYISSLQALGIYLKDLSKLSSDFKKLKDRFEKPYLYLRRSSYDELLKNVEEGVRYLYSLGRARVGEFIGDLNMVIADSISIEDIILGKRIYVCQDDSCFPLDSMSDGFLQVLNILISIYRIENFVRYAEKLGIKLRGILLAEVFDAGVHVDWLVNLLNLIEEREDIKLVAELHTGILLSRAIKRGYPAYYVHDGRAERLTEENITSPELFRREREAYEEVLR